MHGKNVLRVFVLVLAALLLFAAPEKSAAQLDSTEIRSAPTNLLFITGDAADPVAVSAARIQAMPQVQLKIMSPETKGTEIYSGVALKELLASAKVFGEKDTRGNGAKFAIAAVGKDGSKVVLSPAESAAVFGDGGKVIVAISLNQQLLGAAEGPLMLIISDDAGPAHWVHNLARIQISSAK